MQRTFGTDSDYLLFKQAKDMQNVGKIDSIIRVILGISCVVAIVYNYAVETILPLYGVIIIAVLIPLSFKTGFTKFCPIMKGLGISTKKEA